MQVTGKSTGIVGHNVQCAVKAEHHLITSHEVTNAAITVTNSPAWLMPVALMPLRLFAGASRGQVAGWVSCKAFSCLDLAEQPGSCFQQ